jgi:hypothetical protein
VIAHWDDDDWSAPGRLADQLERLRGTGKAVTGYSVIKFTDGQRWWLYPGLPEYAVGTSLCYRRDWWLGHRFPCLQVGEDNQFVFEARTARQIAVVDGTDMMYATVHAGNTSPRDLSRFRNIERPQ